MPILKNLVGKGVKLPNFEDIQRLSDKLGFNLTRTQIEGFENGSVKVCEDLDVFHRIPEPQLPVKYQRSSGYRPDQCENPLNAWYWKCDINGADKGKLSGKRLAIKDNIAVAGVPLMNGSRSLQGYTPEFDATVVTRILDAGGRIAGKSTCEDLCLSGSSFHTALGPVRNPWNNGHLAGGSSSGSAVLVSTGEVDMALGGDQGGSIRIPASHCGIVGLKPTFGLVPYTGIIPLEATLDHVGPMGRTVADVALLLEVIAGNDSGRDPRQSINIKQKDYSQLMKNGSDRLKIGVVKEGFSRCDVDVTDCIQAALEMIKKSTKFSKVEEVSIPAHLDAGIAMIPTLLDGSARNIFSGNGFGGNVGGFQPTSLGDKLRQGLIAHSEDLSLSGKFLVLLGYYLRENYGSHFYCKAQTLLTEIRKVYDQQLSNFDLLIMPTLTIKPQLLPTDETSVEDQLELTMGTVANTAQFNGTGHPALTLNVGFIGDLPVGMMLIGRHYQDEIVLKGAAAVEEILKSKQREWPKHQRFEQEKIVGFGGDPPMIFS